MKMIIYKFLNQISLVYDEKMTTINKLNLNILDNEEILKLVTNICLKSNIEHFK